MNQKLNLISTFLIACLLITLFYFQSNKNGKTLRVLMGEESSEQKKNDDLDMLFLDASSEQKLIGRNVLLRTIQFMIDNREEDDPDTVKQIEKT